MGKIFNEQEVINYLNLPSLPKKQWDGKTSFKSGIGVAIGHDDSESFVILSFDSETDSEPRVTKVFSLVPFSRIDKTRILIVPSYMETNVDEMDLDEQSKKAAQSVINEATELENEGVQQIKVNVGEEGEGEYFFKEITNDTEAQAYIRAYNKKHNLRTSIPTTHEDIVTRLAVMWKDADRKKQKKNNNNKQ